MPPNLGQPMPQRPPVGPVSMAQQLIFNKLYQANPRFRQFADSMRGRSPEDAFREQGLDYAQFQNINPNQVRNLLGF